MDELWFNFCGLFSGDDLDLIVNDIRRPLGPTISENVQEIPGMIGNLFQGNSYSSKTIDVDITISADSVQKLIQKYHDLAELFMQIGDREFPMVFYDEPDYTYYGHFTNLPMPTRPYSSLAQVTLTFVCSDPRAYGEQTAINVDTNPKTFTPQGTGEAFPIFTCIPKKDVTKIAVTDQEGNYAYIGADVDPDIGNSPIDNEPLILHDDCNTLAPWTTVTNPTFNVETGVIQSSFRSTTESFKVALTNGSADFGAPVAGKWHGPCMQRMLTQSCNDYRIRVRFYNNQYYPRAEGKVEAYLLDAKGKRIGKVMLKDPGNSEEVIAQAQIGDYNAGAYHNLYQSSGSVYKKRPETIKLKTKNGTKTVTVKGKKKTEQLWKTVNRTEDLSTGTFTDFYGYIEIQKIGNKFRCEIMKLDDKSNPSWPKPIVATYTDTQNQFSAALSGIALYAAKWDITEDTTDPPKHYTPNGLGITDIRVNNIVNGGNGAQAAPTVIARAGDEIKINCEDGHVYKNTALFMDRFYIGSNWPKMQGGVPNTYGFEPDVNDADWYIDYRPSRM
ncbi:distal tail protein Dit [Sporolactobacillus terrae]|uniref:distal tail protein Dit n=1 Tax=Sporolactobacillus terrae TaxID=269673 RepID=UPI00048FCB57|nr:distal tail protein Dit [Sporolactobacillus terrae]